MVTLFGVFLFVHVMIKFSKMFEEHGENFISNINLNEYIFMSFEIKVAFVTIILGLIPGMP